MLLRLAGLESGVDRIHGKEQDIDGGKTTPIAIAALAKAMALPGHAGQMQRAERDQAERTFKAARLAQVLDVPTWMVVDEVHLQDARMLRDVMDITLHGVVSNTITITTAKGNDMTLYDDPEEAFRMNRTPKVLTPLFDPRWVGQFLAQGEIWKTRGSTDWTKIADMDPNHALNAAMWVAENAQRIMLTAQVADPVTDGFVFAVMTPDEAMVVVVGSPLVQALLRRATQFQRVEAAPWMTTTAS